MKTKVIRVAITLGCSAVAVLLTLALWQHYMVAPWTRDGRIRAEVVSIAPEVAGTVIAVEARDNGFVHKGDVLFVIDPARYRLALTGAEAALKRELDAQRIANSNAKRRLSLSDQAISAEEKEQYRNTLSMAETAVEAAQAQVALATLNLERATVRSPVNGYVTNLHLRSGDYVQVGQARVAVVDSDSFWVVGYFEETKLGGIRPGDSASIDMMGGGATLHGRVDSISRGIADQNAGADGAMLPTVNPVFTWVRLEQRIPVRIHLEDAPPDLALAAGMSCTIVIGEATGLWHDLRAALWPRPAERSGV